MKNLTWTISANLTYGQKIIFLELSQSLILEAAYGPKKTSWKFFHMKGFSSNVACF